MSTPIRRSSPLIAALIVLSPVGLPGRATAQEPAEPPLDDAPVEIFATGRAALDRLDPDDPMVPLIELDPSIAVDPAGDVLYVDPSAPDDNTEPADPEIDESTDDDTEPADPELDEPTDDDTEPTDPELDGVGGDDRADEIVDREPEEPEGLAEPATTDAPEFQRSSRPGASKTILLDFDGHVTTGTSWNAAVQDDVITTGPYDLDGDPTTWSSAELQVIADTWAVVAEDFAPWDVDVTTIEPADPADLTNDEDGDARWGIRVVITPDDWSGCGCGALAYLGSFDDAADEPVFVHNTGFRGLSEATSHAIGHTLGLFHDGGPDEARLYAGHEAVGGPDWAPIMGAAFDRSIGQWSAQEFWGADNIAQDDLSVISSLTNGNGFGLRPDDHGDHLDPTPLNGPSPTITGIIGSRSDTDAFAFTTTGGRVVLSVSGAAVSPNLDAALTLVDERGEVVASADPAEVLSAEIDVELPDGSYTVIVDGVGIGLPFIEPAAGYNDSASLGRYTLTGSIEGAPPADLDPPEAPVGLVGIEVDGRVVLGWAPPTDDEVAGYVIRRSLGDSAPIFDVATTPAARNGHEDPTPPAGVGHYEVVAVDALGNRSAPSNEVVVAVPTSDAPNATRDTDLDPDLEVQPDIDTEAVGDRLAESDEAPERATFVYGDVLGGVAAIAEADGDGVRITETLSGGAERARHDRLDHRWTIPAAEGNQQLWVVAEVAPDAGDLDEGFVVGWSTDRVEWTPLVTIEPGESIDETFDIGAPDEVVHVRVVDTDRTPRQQRPDSVFVDLLRVIGDGREVEPDPEPTEVAAEIRYHYQGLGEGDRAVVITASVTDDRGDPVTRAAVSVDVDGDISETVTITTGSKGTGKAQTETGALRPVVEVCLVDVEAEGLVWEPGPDDCPAADTDLEADAGEPEVDGDSGVGDRRPGPGVTDEGVDPDDGEQPLEEEGEQPGGGPGRPQDQGQDRQPDEEG